MMNPEMMKMAMEQMSRMTPQQMADMQRQMASLPPGFVQQQMASLNSMPPEVLQQRMREASAVGPQGQGQHISRPSPHEEQERLKEEGNQLFSGGKYLEAAAKYERVKSDLEGHTGSEAAALRQKCMLNLASCCLKLCQHDKCIQQCSEVLQSDPGERKALYRRGQSYSALKQFSAAIADLQAAEQRSPEEEKAMIRQKLHEAQDGLRRREHDASVQDFGAKQETKSISEPTGVQAAVPVPAQAALQVPLERGPASSAAAASSSQMPAMTAQSMQQTLQMICENPSMMEEMRDTLASLTPEQMQAAAKMTGMPEAPSFDPQAMRQAVDMMASMRPEALQQMASMAASQQMPSMTSSQDAGAQQQQQVSGSQVQAADPMQALQAMQANPEMMKQAVDMMGQMGPEQMASMMGSMSPGMPGGQPDPSAMAGLLADPKSRELMRQMMANIDPQQLAAMSKASGQALTPEQAETLSAQMRNMSDAQMDKLLSAVSWIQRALSGLQAVKRKIMENRLLALAIITLFIAVLLRWMGLL